MRFHGQLQSFCWVSRCCHRGELEASVVIMNTNNMKAETPAHRALQLDSVVGKGELEDKDR